MSIVSQTLGVAGQNDVSPRRVQMTVTDSLGTITTAGYLNSDVLQPDVVYPTDIFDIIYSFNTATGVGTYGEFLPSFGAQGVITLVASEAVYVTTSSATPGTIRALVGKVTGTATTMTSGNLVGVRGEVDLVGASGGFLYGVQGKVIPSGTLSGSSWTAGVFAQFDLSNATINAGQTAPVWADYGATGGTFTNVTGARMFAGTNTVSGLTLFAMDYRYGKATNLLELDGSSSTYISSGGSGAPSGTVQKIAISIDGVQYYIVASTVVS